MKNGSVYRAVLQKTGIFDAAVPHAVHKRNSAKIDASMPKLNVRNFLSVRIQYVANGFVGCHYFFPFLTVCASWKSGEWLCEFALRFSCAVLVKFANLS